MDVNVVEMMVLLAAIVGSGSMTAVGMWFWSRVKRLERENADLLALTRQMEGFTGQLGEVQGHVAELYERLDFAERLLTKGRESQGST